VRACGTSGRHPEVSGDPAVREGLDEPTSGLDSATREVHELIATLRDGGLLSGESPTALNAAISARQAGTPRRRPAAMTRFCGHPVRAGPLRGTDRAAGPDRVRWRGHHRR
jgi:hypothetical protein